MDYHIDRKIQFVQEAELQSDCNWALQEMDENGAKVGGEQQPWEWSLIFTASELCHNNTININQSDDSEEGEDKEPVSEEYEYITGTLHSGGCFDGNSLDYDVLYSFFGTDRRLNQFGLTISKLEKDDGNERCHLLGMVSYTTEIDFRDDTTDDDVTVHLWLSSEKFNKIADTIKAKRTDIVEVQLGKVDGFYSEWSPEVRTNNIKVLASDDQQITFPENCEIAPPKLGSVGTFRISLIQRNKINLKQDLRPTNTDKLFNVLDEDYQEFSDTETDMNSQFLVQLVRNERVLGKLRAPLWLIFIVLLLSLIKLAL